MERAGRGGRRELVLHVGASKTGTSALQAGLFGSVDSLAEQGVGLPLVGRGAHVAEVLRPLGWVTSRGFVRPPRPARLEHLVARIAATPQPRLLLTNEDLCEADAERIGLLAGVLDRAGVDVRVVLTVRSLSSVLPSEWQQFLKHRLTLDYPTFLERARDRRGRVARHLWLRQDAAAVVDRWAAVVGVDRVEVVVTPSRSVDPGGLYRTFGEVVGFDPQRLVWPERDANASWGYVEAEVYRRLNLALGDRLAAYERDYQPAVRWPLVRGVLARGASGRITLPPEHIGWVRARAVETCAALRASGVRVHGDLDALVPGPDDGRELPALEEAALARAAIEALANLAVHTHRRDQRTASAPPRRPGTGRLRRRADAARRRAGRLAGRVARRARAQLR